MKKALIVATVFGFVGSFEKNNIRILEDLGFDVFVATNMSDSLGDFGDRGQLDGFDVKKCQIDFSRSPLSLKIFKAYRQLKSLIKKGNFDLIHCHTPVAGILTRLAARKSGTKVIYTAHGFHFYKGAPLLNWLIYYPAEKLCSKYCDTLVTINKEDYHIAKNKMNTKRIEYIPGVGIDTEKFSPNQELRDKTRQSLGVSSDEIMVLSVGELNANKNHITPIKAIKDIDNVKYFIAGNGPLYDELQKYQSDKFRLLGYRTDTRELFCAADIFLLPSIREGLSVATMEAMACAKPCIISDIRGNRDLIEENGGRLVMPTDILGFSRAVEELKQENLFSLGEYNLNKIKDFSKEVVISKMKNIYGDIYES